MEYCLNYAGCKASIFFNSRSCFWSTALTMRDVKFTFIAESIKQLVGTALTMRDVKLFTPPFISPKTTAYCLNYAGCKVHILSL